MKSILALHNEQPNSCLDLTYFYKIQTKMLDAQFQDQFFCEVGKQLHVAKHKLLDNEDIIGMSQNRRFFKFFIKGNPIEQNILLNYDMIIPEIWYINDTLFDLQLKGCFFQRIPNNLPCINLQERTKIIIKVYREAYKVFSSLFSDVELEYIKSKKCASFHNIFLAKKQIFYDYSDYLYTKLNYIKNTDLYFLIKNLDSLNVYAKKQGAWIAEVLLNTFCFTYNIKTKTSLLEYIEK